MSTKRLRVGPEDPDDDQYLIAAIEGRAQFVVTGDAHLLNIRQYEGVRIVTAREKREKLLLAPSSENESQCSCLVGRDDSSGP